MTNYSSYKEVMTKKIIPHREEQPDWIRLDGRTSGGNREVYAYFNYKDQKWRIHSDSHFRMLFKAYEYVKNGKDPFLIAKTNKDNKCLILIPALAERPKYFYIYLVK